MINRIFDMVLVLILTPFAIGIFVFCAILLFFDDGRPVIFSQARVGYKKKLFTCYKLRTMRLETPDVVSHLVDTSTVSGLGRLLRKFKLDELPQLWNIFRGDMRFVGPRPGLPVHEELTRIREEFGIFDVLPGVTGLAQINNVDMSDPKKLAEWDKRYIESQSFSVDLKLMFQTVVGYGRGDAAA